MFRAIDTYFRGCGDWMHTGAVRGTRSTLVALSLAVALSACSGPALAGADSPGDAAEVSETPAAEVSIEGDLDGNGQLSEREKEILAQAAPRDYVLPDGSTIRIDPTVPLPQPVRDVIAAQGAGLSAQFTGDPMNDESVLSQMWAFADLQLETTGRGVILVYAMPGDGGTWWCTAASGARSPVLASLNQQEILTASADWADSRNYDLVLVS